MYVRILDVLVFELNRKVTIRIELEHTLKLFVFVFDLSTNYAIHFQSEYKKLRFVAFQIAF